MQWTQLDLEVGSPTLGRYVLQNDDDKVVKKAIIFNFGTIPLEKIGTHMVCIHMYNICIMM